MHIEECCAPPCQPCFPQDKIKTLTCIHLSRASTSKWSSHSTCLYVYSFQLRTLYFFFSLTISGSLHTDPSILNQSYEECNHTCVHVTRERLENWYVFLVVIAQTSTHPLYTCILPPPQWVSSSRLAAVLAGPQLPHDVAHSPNFLCLDAKKTTHSHTHNHTH